MNSSSVPGDEYDVFGFSDEDDDFFNTDLGDDDNFEIKEFDASVEGYPDPYCSIVQSKL